MATDTRRGEDLRGKPAHIKEGIEPSEVAHGVTNDHKIPWPLGLQIIFHDIGLAEVHRCRAGPLGTRTCNGSGRDIQRHHVVCQADQVLREGPRTTAQFENMSIATPSEQRHEPCVSRLLECRAIKFPMITTLPQLFEEPLCLLIQECALSHGTLPSPL